MSPSNILLFAGVIKRKLSGQCYEVQWCKEAGDGASQKQSVVHVFGSMVQPRTMHIGDHVIALAIPSKPAHNTCSDTCHYY